MKKWNGNALHVAGDGTESKYVMYMRSKTLPLFGDEARAKLSERTDGSDRKSRKQGTGSAEGEFCADQKLYF